MTKRTVQMTLDVPPGYEPTGEYRAPTTGEYFLTLHGVVGYGVSPNEPRVILRKVESVKKSVFVNIYPCGAISPHKTRELADNVAASGRVECRELTFEITPTE